MPDGINSLEIVHVVRSDGFAGVERYICSVANKLAGRGHRVHVIGGDPRRMSIELDELVQYSSAVSVGQAWLAVAACGSVSLVHAHMTAAEAAAVCCSFRHRAPIVSTRHFPDSRGSSASGRLAGVVVRRKLARQIAISRFVADGIAEPSVVIYNGVPNRQPASLEARRVVMMQRLEAEKAPEIGIRAWVHSGLAASGWELAIAGAGTLDSSLRRSCVELGVGDSVHFLGSITATDALLRSASIVLAPAPAEPFGLTVAEGMAHGIPIVAAAGGGHLETLGPDGCLFEPDDAEAAGKHLASLGSDPAWRRAVGSRLRARQRRLFSIDLHVQRLEELYVSLLPGGVASESEVTPRASVAP